MTITSLERTAQHLAEDAVKRAEIIAGLRALADVLEQVPQLPIGNYMSWAFPGRDNEAIPAYQAAVEALRDANLPYEYTTDVDVHSRGIRMRLHGLKFDLSHMHDKSWADYKARQSYQAVVQVDAEQDGPVAL